MGLTQVVAERGLYGQRGARNLVGWLRADARVADDAWKLARLALAAAGLPQVTGLLAAGTVSLSQAATACWQIGQLPDVPRRPQEFGPAGAAPPGPGARGSEPSEMIGSPAPPDLRRSTDDCAAGARDDGVAGEAPPNGTLDGDFDGGCAGDSDSAGMDGDRWAGLWRLGNVHAAADELFAGVLPGLVSGQLRQLGAQLREAAAPEQRAREEQDGFARRGLRICRSLGGCGEITGRLHAEAAEQVIAAFGELGAKAGPGDPRTKAQRWADALTRLCATATAAPQPATPSAAGTQPPAGQSPAGRQDPSGGNGGSSPDGSSSREGAPGQERRQASPGRDHGGHSDSGPVPAGYQRPRLIVSVPLATLLGQPLAVGATIVGPGTPLTHEAARRLACDAQIMRLLTDPSPRPPTSNTHPTISPPSGGGSSAIEPSSSGPPADPLRNVGPPEADLSGRPLSNDTTPSGGPSSGKASTKANGTPRGAHLADCTHHRGRLPDGATHRSGTATGELTERLAAGLAQLPPPLAGPSAVLDIGRASPGWTPRQRDALAAQYGGRCSQPGCGGPIDVIHHIVHWADGGPTSIHNGLPCCLYHHWLIHAGGWRVAKHPDGAVTAIPPPPGWRPGTVYRHGKPLPEHRPAPGADDV